MAERKTGTWIARHGWAQCSECGKWQQNIYDWENWQNYCGHCGAEMTHMKAAPKEKCPLDDRLLNLLLNAAARRIARRYKGIDMQSHVFVGGTRYIYEIRVDKGGEY